MGKRFDNIWKDFLKEHGSIRKARKYSYNLWNDKYVKSKLDPKPQEEFTDTLLIPGKIYTCFYANTDDVKKGSFVDHWPVILSFGHIEYEGKLYETGIDFNLVPEKIRTRIITTFYDFYEKTINENLNKIGMNKHGKKPIRITFDLAKKLLDGTGWERAYVTLFREKMGKIKVFDYADWPAVVALNTNGIRGTSLDKIWTEYIRNMGKQLREKEGFFDKLIKK